MSLTSEELLVKPKIQRVYWEYIYLFNVNGFMNLNKTKTLHEVFCIMVFVDFSSYSADS